ncbi:hypothetical protein Rhopal_002094-T1 [Rhodotorula paludigena]|uniref:Proteophosphoglycan ppg4 n=1 Tax=Rhodotorula paludigena TaxID=86838 RepID=A0AAV5G9C7_9BASI|nr:hypothetical protein Rhopal_002094-T1 [Rhodotorula paludigena]
MPRAGTRGAAPKPAGPLVFDGAALRPNDHVYVSAPWDDREGEPYIVARVLEILQPSSKAALALPEGSNTDANPAPASDSAPSSRSGSTAPTTDLRVRVAYYFRTRDITSRYVADHRLVVATMHADTLPASYVRGRCTVKHREHIEELEVYKRQPDTFYWHQLYDRYLHRYFDAVPTYKVRNAPPEVITHLNANFEFVLCEVGTAAEICDAQRGCCVCHKWAANPESVACARCARVFHLSCVDPPLAAKPKAGYGWSCAPCSKAHDEEVEGYLEAGMGPPPGGSPGPQMLHASKKGKARQVDAQVRPDPHDWRMTQGWPFRYFGMHTNAYNVLDPHDSLYPRASTRLGNKFQCTVPAWDESTGQQEVLPGSRQYFQPKRSRASTPSGGKPEKERSRKSKAAEIPPRGEDGAVQIIFRPSDKISDETMDELFARVRKISSYATAGVDLLNRAAVVIQNKEGSVQDTIASLRKISLASLGHATWTDDEKRKLSDGAEQHHNDIGEIHKLLPAKKMGDVVKRYYIAVGHTLQEDEPTQIEEKTAVVAAAVIATTRSGRKTGRKAARDAAAAVAPGEDGDPLLMSDDEDHGSVCAPARTPAQRRNRFCAICEATESPKWWFCPDNICELEVKPNPCVMCDTCGVRWRHYGAQYPPYGDELKPLPQEKKSKKDKAAEEEARKQAELEAAAALAAIREPTPPPPKPVIPPKPCLLCKRFEPKTALFQCDNCTISYHASCYGIDLDWEWPHDEWLCNMCERDKNRKKLTLHPHCILCPPPPELEPDAPLTALDCLKPTELQNYVHLLCAIWHRELQIGSPPVVQPVEAFQHLPPERRDRECCLCKTKGVGSTIKCEDCSKHVHVSCAWTSGYKFAFEVQRVRNKKRPPKDAVIIKFKDEEGVLQPCIWCTDHHFTHSERKTYDLGARDQSSKLTALQMYVRSSKAGKFPDAPLLLRQGRRLDPTVQPVLKPKAPTPPPPPAPSSKHTDTLLASIIEEEPAPQPARGSKKRRTQSMTPAIAIPPNAPAAPDSTSSTPITATMLPEMDVDLDVLPAAEKPLPAKRERKPKAPRELASPVKTTKAKGASKKRKSAPAAPIEEDLSAFSNAYHGFDLVQQLNLPALPDLAALTSSLQLPPLPPAYSGATGLPSLPALPALPSLPNVSSPFDFSPATSAPHLLNTVVYSAHIPTPDLAVASEPAAPASQADVEHEHEEDPSAIDPALQALSALAAAEADSRNAQQQQQDDVSEIDRQHQQAAYDFAQVMGDIAVAAESQEEHGESQVTNADDANGDDGEANAADGERTGADGAPASEEAAGDDDASASGRPKRRTRAPVRPYDVPTPSASRPRASGTPRSLQQLNQPAPRPQSPLLFDATHPNSLLNYVRAHESAQNMYRIDTPDDSDGLSEHLPSPGGSALNSPALLHAHPPALDNTAFPDAGLLQTPPAPPKPAKRRRTSTKGSGTPAVCSNCGTSDSPLFRRDAEGRQLCNSCGLYFKTHGHDRPQKVIARAIGAARVQKRKAQAAEGGEPSPSSAKRPKASGTPLPLQGLAYAPVNPSPLQPMPAFSYDSSYSPQDPVAGPSGSSSHHSEHAAPNQSRSASAPGANNGLHGIFTGGYPAYDSPYGGYGSPTPASQAAYDSRFSAATHSTSTSGAHATAPQYPYPPGPSGSGSGPYGNSAGGYSYPSRSSAPPHAGGSGYYDPFALSTSAGTNGANGADESSQDQQADDEALAQRHALESLAAQALSFSVGQAVHNPPLAADSGAQEQQPGTSSGQPATAPPVSAVAAEVAPPQAAHEQQHLQPDVGLPLSPLFGIERELERREAEREEEKRREAEGRAGGQ